MNTQPMKENIEVFKLLNSPFAVSTEEGEILFNSIKHNLEKDQTIEVDFKGIDLIVSTFLNAAIGQLYGQFKTDFIQDHVHIKNMSEDDLDTLKKVTDRAKEYFNDKSGFERVFKKHFPDA